MNWLISILFESVVLLGALLGLLLFMLLVHWRQSGRSRPLLIGLAVALVLLVVQALVVTKREHAGRILETIEQDIVASKTDALAAALAADFDADGLDREAFLAYVRRQMERVDVKWVDRWLLRVDQSETDRFVVTVSYRADVVLTHYAGNLPSNWSLTFVCTADGWRIAHVRPLSIAGDSSPTWDRIDRHRRRR